MCEFRLLLASTISCSAPFDKGIIMRSRPGPSLQHILRAWFDHGHVRSSSTDEAKAVSTRVEPTRDQAW